MLPFCFAWGLSCLSTWSCWSSEYLHPCSESNSWRCWPACAVVPCQQNRMDWRFARGSEESTPNTASSANSSPSSAEAKGPASVVNEFHHDSLCFITFYQSDPFNMLGEGDRIQKVPEFRAGDSGDSEFSAPGWFVDSLFSPPASWGSLDFIRVALSFFLSFSLPPSCLGSQLRAPDLSGHCRTSTVSFRSQWALPDLDRQRQISVSTAEPQPRSRWALPDLNRELQISAGPKPRAPDLGGHCRTSTKSARSQWVLPDLNILQPRAPDLSGHCRTSTASARSQWALPDLNRDLSGHCRTSTASSKSLPGPNRERQISVGTAGPQPRAPDLSGYCQTSTYCNQERQISAGTAGPQPQAPDLSGHCQTSTKSARSQWAPDLSGICRASTASSGTRVWGLAVWQCLLRSGACGWGPSGSAHGGENARIDARHNAPENVKE